MEIGAILVAAIFTIIPIIIAIIAGLCGKSSFCFFGTLLMESVVIFCALEIKARKNSFGT